VAASVLPGAHPDAGKLLLPALNEMIDVTTKRTAALRIHPPEIIYCLLFALALLASILAGRAMATGKHKWTHMIGFCIAVVGVVLVILNLEYPRFGLIRVDVFDELLRQVRASMS
jgi:hypothetical protein